MEVKKVRMRNGGNEMKEWFKKINAVQQRINKTKKPTDPNKTQLMEYVKGKKEGGTCLL